MIIKRTTILILLIISVSACNNNPEDNLDNQTDNISIKELSVYDLKIKKINAITDCFNGYSKSAFIAYQDYVSSFGNDEDHYKPKEVSNFIGINAFGVQRVKYLEEVVEIPVLDELNPLITSYKINAKAFSVALNSCERYYSKKGFKEDNFENGKGMHKPVIEIFKRFSVADSLLRIKSNKISKKLESEHLTKLKKDGLEVEYLLNIGKNEAEKLNQFLIAISYDDLSAEQLVVLFDRIKNTYTKLNEVKNTNSNQFNVKSTACFANFEQFFKAFNELYIHKKEKRKFSRKELKKLEESEETARSVEGSIDKVIYQYKELVKSFNKNLVSRISF